MIAKATQFETLRVLHMLWKNRDIDTVQVINMLKENYDLDLTSITNGGITAESIDGKTKYSIK